MNFLLNFIELTILDIRNSSFMFMNLLKKLKIIILDIIIDLIMKLMNKIKNLKKLKK